MRNALYSGVGTQWLSRMVKRDEFLEATGRSLNSKTMRDREAVNRFAAFHVLGMHTIMEIWTNFSQAPLYF